MGTKSGTADRFGGLESTVRRQRTCARGGALRDGYLPDQLCGAPDAAGRRAQRPVTGADTIHVMYPMHIFQILNHYTAPQDLDPGFAVLDNSANERPDWYEYWPIRKFLLNEALDEDAFYGFLSPKLKSKTSFD